MPDLSEFDVRDTILEVAVQITRHRPAAAAVTADGYAGTPTYTDTTISAYYEPAGDGQLRRLPEGKRAPDTLRVLVPETDDEATDPALLGGSVASNTLPDELTIEGDRWQVVDINHYTPTGRYYDALIQRTGRG